MESSNKVLCVEYCGDRSDPSVSTETSYCIPNNPVDGRQQAVCFQSCGDRANPSVSVSDTAYCIPANPMSDRQQAVCIPLTNRGVVPEGGVQQCITGAFMGGQGAKARSIAWCEDGTTPTLKSAPSGGNTVPDVVYPINLMVATRGGRDDMRTCFGIGQQNEPQFTLSSAHEHAVFYEVNPDG